MPLKSVSLDGLIIDDDDAFAAIDVYPRLKDVLLRSGCRFFVLTGGSQQSWDRATFLNLTYWASSDGADVLCEPRIAADVVAHVAWHHLAAQQLELQSPARNGERASAHASFFAESIASAFDLYLLGKLLARAPGSDFVLSQAPIMAEAAAEAGADEDAFAELLNGVAHNPERAFEELRALLLDACVALVACPDVEAAQAVLERFEPHRFGPLLHHYQLSNWILHARAYAGSIDPDAGVQAIDTQLRAAESSLQWLVDNWLS